MTTPRADITGQRFGKLVAIRPLDKKHNESIVWELLCDCGKIKETTARVLRSGSTNSCGCLRSEKWQHRPQKNLKDGKFNCRECKLDYPLEEKCTGKGYMCQPCAKDYRKEMRAINVGHYKETRRKWASDHKEHLVDQGRKYRVQDPAKFLFYAARSRARKAGIAFNIEMSDVVVPTHCPVLGIPLVVAQRQKGHPTFTDGSPSLDRLDSTKGYIKGNVDVISWRANSLKKNATSGEIEALLTWMKAKSL